MATKSTKVTRLRARIREYRKRTMSLHAAEGKARKGLATLRKRLANLTKPKVPGMNPGGWHPDAIENQPKAPLSWVAGTKPKLVWHTTETVGLPSYNGVQPHFTLDPWSGKLWQHVPIRGGAYALENRAGGVETNRAHAIQVELVAYSDASINRARSVAAFGDREYANLAKLARWIEKHAGVKRACSVKFENRNHPMPMSAWPGYEGHCGHQHAPEQAHWDPDGLKIDKVLG